MRFFSVIVSNLLLTFSLCLVGLLPLKVSSRQHACHFQIINVFLFVVEKTAKYYLLRNLMIALFEIIDSDKIPVKTTSKQENTSPMIGNAQPNFGQSSAANSTKSIYSSHSPSTTSFPNSKDWFKRLTSYTSFPSSSLDSSSNDVDLNNEMVELIARCLKKCGEEEGYIPLFKVIFTTLDEVTENRYTRLLDGRARDILLTGVITRMVHYVSKHVGLVFISDDVQWADTASIRVLQHIHEHCQRVMLLMATRPIKDYNVSFIEEYRATGSHEEIELNGLGEFEIGEIILQNFDSGVNRISPAIVKVVQVSELEKEIFKHTLIVLLQKRTGGNPLYVK